MTNFSYPAFPIFAFLGFVACLIPLPWHLEAWNSGTCFYMLWAAIACLNQFVNAVVWNGNALNPAPVWCDISTRIIIGASVGIPASSMCIMRRLYHIGRAQAVAITRAEKRRAVLVDSLICILLPVICMALAYVVQGHRFDIFEDIGCYPVIYNTLAAYFLVFSWPVLLGMISAIYCVLAIRTFAKRRAQFNQFLSSNSSLTASRYVRLMALAAADLFLTVPLAVYVIITNSTAAPLEPWRGWADTHFDFSRIDQIPAVIWSLNHGTTASFELSRWLNPACALLFFAFFGLASEARRHYRQAFLKIRSCIPLRTSQTPVLAASSPLRSAKGMALASNGSLPIYLSPLKPPFPSLPRSLSRNGTHTLSSPPSTPTSLSASSTDFLGYSSPTGHGSLVDPKSKPPSSSA